MCEHLCIWMRVSSSASVAIFIYPCVCMNVFVLTDIIACVHTSCMYLQVMQEEGERSYHIFYQLASQAGTDSQLTRNLQLRCVCVCVCVCVCCGFVCLCVCVLSVCDVVCVYVYLCVRARARVYGVCVVCMCVCAECVYVCVHMHV